MKVQACIERSFSWLPCLVFATGLAFSQATTSVRGHVTDPSGAAIPGAQIHLTRTDTNVSRDTVSNNEGFYEILQLAPGVYQLTTKANGFTDAERTNLELQVSLPATSNFQLQVAGAAQTRPATVRGAMAAKALIRSRRFMVQSSLSISA